MKKILALLLVLVMLFSLVACSKPTDEQKDNPNAENTDTEQSQTAEETAFDYMTADLTKYLKLGQYEGLTVTREDPMLTDEEFERYVNNILSDYSDYEHITDREIVEGDKVHLDYSGAVGNEQFGGTALNQIITAGDGNGQIPGFGAALIGHKAGDQFVAEMTYPDPFPNDPENAGKPVAFAFNIHYILGEDIETYTYDTIDDLFVKNTFNYDTVEEFLSSVRTVVQNQKTYTVLRATNFQVLEQVVENSEVIGYPEAALMEIYDLNRKTQEQYAENNGVDYETYIMQTYGMTDEDIMNDCKAAVKENLVIYSLVKALDAEVTESEINGKIAFMADLYGVKPEEFLQTYPYDEMKELAQFDKVLSIVASIGVEAE